MAIPANAQTSNPLVRDALAGIPLDNGAHVHEKIFPNVSVDAERVNTLVTVEQALELDSLRAVGAEFKEVTFAEGALAEIALVERGQKSTIDARQVELAGVRGVNLQAERAAFHRQDIADIFEYLGVTLGTTGSNFAASHTDDAINFLATGIKDVFEAACEVILADGGFDPRTPGLGSWEIGTTVYSILRNNPDIKAFAGVGGGVAAAKVNLAVLEAFFDMPPGSITVARYRRQIGANAAAKTEFFPVASALLHVSRPTLTNRTFGATPHCLYGSEFGRAGVDYDARTEPLPGIEKRIEIGAMRRARSLILNASLGFLWTGVTNV